MNEPSAICKTDWRRKAVRRRGLNGLDYLEVEFDEQDQTCMLIVHFINQAPDPQHPPRLSLEGGQRIPASAVRAKRPDLFDKPARPLSERGLNDVTHDRPLAYGRRGLVERLSRFGSYRIQQIGNHFFIKSLTRHDCHPLQVGIPSRPAAGPEFSACFRNIGFEWQLFAYPLPDTALELDPDLVAIAAGMAGAHRAA